MRITHDTEPMLYAAVRMVKLVSGDSGEPTAKELRAAKQYFLGKQGQYGDFDVEAFTRAQERSLPEGVTLTEAYFSRQEMKQHYQVEFAFDHFEKLVAVELEDSWKGKFASAGRLNQMVQRPFAFRLVDDGETLLVTSEPINPMVPTPEINLRFARELKGLRVYLKIDAPFEVVEHNATLVEGRALIWEYDYETLKRGSAPAQIRVRYRR